MKKKLSMLLSVVLLITGLGMTAARAEFSDVASENPYRKAILTLSMLETSSGQKIINGYEDGTFKPDGAITRAECAKIITGVLNIADVNIEDVPFTDVDGHWAKNSIGMCASRGIINGMGDGTFAPDAQITYEQILKMIVCTLGYSEPAEGMGGYPEGYISQANSLGLLDKISGQGFSDNAARGVVAQVVYNALEVKIAQSYEGGTTVTDRTLLKDSLKTEQVKGTLVGVEESVTADCTRTLGKGMLDIRSTDGEEHVLSFSKLTSDVNEISRNLGQALTVYCKESTTSTYPEIIAIDYETAQNKVIEISSFDIDSYNGSQLVYYEGSSRRTERVHSDKISIRYNGKLIGSDDYIELTDLDSGSKTVTATEALIDWLNPSSNYYIYGSIKLVDSGNDGVDMIEILDYETLVVYANPTTADYRVQDRLKTTHYLILDPNSVQYTYAITKDGSTIETTNISANDVLLYARSIDGSVITVTDTAKSFTGSITSVNDTEAMLKITVNGNEYRVSDACLAYLKANDGRDLKSGLSGTFYPDALGTISYVTLSAESAIPYAYIISAADDIETDTVYVTAYLPSNNASAAKVYPMANRVMINGSSMKDKAAVDYLKNSGSGSNKDADRAEQIYGPNKYPSYSTTAQLVRMKLNSEGKVSEIVTLNNESPAGTQNEDVTKLVRYQELGRYYYTSNSFRESASSSASLFTTNSSTAVIYIPMERGDRDKYSNRTASSAFSSGEAYYVEAYNVNASKIAGLVVLYGTDGSMTKVTRNTDFSIVASQPGVEYNEDKNTTSIRMGVYRGAVNTPSDWLTYDDTEFSGVRAGDVIQFAYDSDNLAQGLVMNIPFSDISKVLDNTDDDVIYDWSEEVYPTAGNNWQSYKFDYRFKTTGSDGAPVPDGSGYADEPYTSTTIGTVPYSRAYMANVAQILQDENKLYLTKKGFTNDGGNWVYDEGDYEEVTVSSSTKVIRMTSNRRGFDRYIDGTTTDLKYTDLRDAKNYGTDCSKVLVCTQRGTVRLIVVYE